MEHPRLPRQSRRKKRGSSAREGFSWESCSPLFVAAKHKPDLVPVFNNHIRSCSTTQFSFTPLTGPSWEKVFFFLSHFLFLKCCTPLENILSNPFHRTKGRFPQHFWLFDNPHIIHHHYYCNIVPHQKGNVLTIFTPTCSLIMIIISRFLIISSKSYNKPRYT